MSQAGKIFPGGITTPVDSITGNAGGAVSPDAFGNINLVGAGIVTITGTPASNLLTVTITDPVPVTSGGTGLATITNHGVMVGSGTSDITPLSVGTDGQVIVGSTGADPVFADITSTGGTITISGGAGTLNIEATGGAVNVVGLDGDTGSAVPTLGVIDILGGNNITTAAALSAVTVNVSGTTQYALQVGDATASLDSLAIGTATQVLQSGGAGANPAWSTATYPATTAQGDVIYSSAANTVVGLTKDANATRYISNTGATNNPAWAQIELTNGVTGILPVPNGGTGASTLTDHGVMIGSGVGAVTILAAGPTNSVLLGQTGADPVWGQVDLTTDVTGTLPVANGGTGTTTLTDHGILLGSGTNAVTPLGVATNGQFPIGSTAADPVLGNITSTEDLTITNGAGTISIDFTTDTNLTAIHGWNGSMIESASVIVTAAGGVITLSIEKAGGGNLTPVFSDGFYTWVTAPDTVTLTAGSDTSPQINYVYLLQSTKTLTASTVGWPATEFAAVATVLCQSAASLQTEGAYKMHAWTDHVMNPVDQGHVSMINKWIRQQNATWVSGVGQTLTITPNGGAADNVIFTSAAGIVYQLHKHTFPAFAGTPDVYTVNDSATAYNIVTDLNALLTDSTGASMSGKYFSLVIWGVVNEATGDCKLMVNLPGGSYNTQAALLADSSKYTNFSIPSDFKGTGFLIYQMNLKHSVAASGTWTSVSNIDLRGLIPSLAPGGATAFATEFEDNTFRILDNGDNTKEIAFEASAISNATTRTITMDDRDIDMDAVATTVATDVGNAVPAGGTLTIAGGTNLNSAGAGSTATINLDASISAMTAVDFAAGGRIGTATSAGNTLLVQAYDVDGTAYVTFATLTANNTPTMDLDDAVTKASNYIYRAAGTDVPVTDGGTGVSSITDHALMVGSGAGAITTLAAATNGQIAIGSTGADPVIAAITQGANITVTNGAGSITIASTASGGIAWNIITADLDPMIVDNGYICNKAGLLTVTLPTTAAVGTIQRVTGINTDAGWLIEQSANQIIHFGSVSTTTGAGGSLASTLKRDSVELVCVVADLEWNVISSVGNITVV